MSTAHWSSSIGDSLVTGGSTTVSTDAHLNGKFVMLYFSAHWCGPCRQFTPALSKFYTDLKQKRSDFEIVFVSSDRDDASFDDYFGTMPWVALPFSEREKKAQLSSQYGVRGIPTLVVLNTDGSVITKDGREALMTDREGDDFPWIPKPVTELMGESFDGHNGAKVSRSDLAGKFIGFYFSAEWCPPCKGFTPKLISYYQHRKSLGKNDLEIIFCSSDKSAEQYNEYFGSMPWISIPFNDPRIAKLSNRFGVDGIPTLVIVDANGEVVTKNGRAAVMEDPRSEKTGPAAFPYYPEPVENLATGAESYGFDINSKPALVLFMENSDDTDQEAAKNVIASFAETMAKAKASSPNGPEMIFFYSFQPNDLAVRIRQLCKLEPLSPKSGTQMVLLDIPDNGGYYVYQQDEVTAEALRTFLEQFKAGSLERRQLG